MAPDLPARTDRSGAPAAGADPVAMLLADKRSPQTRRAYAGDLRDFFGCPGRDPDPDTVRGFVSLPPAEIAFRLNRYKAELLGRGAAEATVNRRLAAVRSLLQLCHRLGFAATDGRALVDGEKVQVYRDTRGIDLKTLRKLLRKPGVRDLKGRRDTALLRLLAENALRRAEVCALTVADFRPAELRLYIRGKGRGSQSEPVTLSRKLAELLAAYLADAGHTDGPLFRNLDHRPESAGAGLTPSGLYQLVGDYGRAIGLPRLTPHQLRHTAITLALDAGEDVRRVQRLSRHKDIRTLQLYDDNRADLQGEVSRKLSSLIG